MMTRPLPDIDLARIAPLPKEMKRASLEQIRSGRPPFSYKPLRSCLSDIFNIQTDLDFGLTDPTPWNKIENLLERRAVSSEELEHNLRVARGLHDFAGSGRILGRKQEFFPLSMGHGRKVVLWQSMIIAIEGKPHAVFIEPRRTRGLTKEGRRFAFSMMHERIRAADEDFADIGLAILKFEEPNEGRRPVRLFTDQDVDLHSMNELELMVSETYEMWREISDERTRETRGRATGTGPLGI